jgi:hypothetical protein
MNIKRMVTGLLAALALSWLPAAVYAGNSTEFGVAGDLSVYGNNGTLVDPDVKVKGFSVFGATQAVYAGMTSLVPGGVVVNSALAVSSGAYFLGGSTFAAGGAYFTDVSSFTAGPSKIFVNGGTNGQVMSYNGATGALQWANVSSLVSGDNMGDHIATMTLQMSDFGIVNVASITANGYITTYSSMTVGGNEGVGGNLTANGQSQLGAGNTVINGINQAPEANVALAVQGDPTTGGTKYVAKFYSGAALAAWIRTK